MKYYHVTSFKDANSILKTGLHGQVKGQIFVFTVRKAAALIALHQCGHWNYALLSIDSKGITGKIENDNVAELTAYCQRIIRQITIAPRFIKLLGFYKICQPRLTNQVGMIDAYNNSISHAMQLALYEMQKRKAL